MAIFQQTIALFIYMGIGYFACKKGIFDYSTGKALSWIVVNVANPALIISSVVNGDGTIEGKNLLITVVIATVMYLAMILLAHAIPKVLHIKKDEENIYNLMTIFNNIGNMGFPIISAMYGVGALLYVSIFILGFNLLAYTYGYQVIQKKNGEKFKIDIKKFFNIGFISCLVSIFLYLTQMQVPEFFKTTVSGLGGLMGPLGMMVIGISLNRMRLIELFTDGKLLAYAFIKLIIIPIIGTIIVKQFLTNEVMCLVCMVMMASPAANIIVMFAQQYDNGIECATKGVALTNLLSVLTIPFVSMIVL